MRILIAGDWRSELHEEAVYRGLIQLGYSPARFSWHQYFKVENGIAWMLLPLLKAQNKYMIGPLVDRLNRDLISAAAEQQPEMIFFYRGTHIYPETLRELRKVAPDAILVGYNNDDPFSPNYPKWKWRHFLACVPEYDLVLAYRHHNIQEFEKVGAKRVDLLRSWFIPERNFPVELSKDEQVEFGSDVVFIGHYEDDGRLQYLEEIVRQGWHLRIFGPDYEWDSVLRSSTLLRKHAPTRMVWGLDYNRALCGAKVALCFFSKLNRDTYTRRCFEIPASGTVLFSQFSGDLASLFAPDQEAVFFRNIGDMNERLEWLLSDDVARKKIASAGTKRLWQDGHDVVSRISTLIKRVGEIKGDLSGDVAFND